MRLLLNLSESNCSFHGEFYNVCQKNETRVILNILYRNLVCDILITLAIKSIHNLSVLSHLTVELKERDMKRYDIRQINVNSKVKQTNESGN